MKHHVQLHQRQTVRSNAGKQRSLQREKNGVVTNIAAVQMKPRQKTLHQVHLADGDHPKSQNDQIYQILKFIKHVFLLVMIAIVQLLLNQSALMAIGSMAKSPVNVLNGNSALTSHTGQSEMVTGNVKIMEALEDVLWNVTIITLCNQLFQQFHHQIQVSDVHRINLFSMDGWNVT